MTKYKNNHNKTENNITQTMTTTTANASTIKTQRQMEAQYGKTTKTKQRHMTA